MPEDDAEAVKWYRKAAEQGHADAQYNLGDFYADTTGISIESLYVPKNRLLDRLKTIVATIEDI